MKYHKIEKETIDAIQIQKETIREALTFVGAGPLTDADGEIFADSIETKGLYIQSAVGPEHASIGDYIIRTDEGYSIMKGPLFDSLYEKVTE